MKIFALAATALLATVAYAAPAPVEVRNAEVLVTFFGAADASFTQYFSTGGNIEYIYNRLSISKISVAGGASCTFYGADGSVTTVEAGSTQDVGQPQSQVKGYCHSA